MTEFITPHFTHSEMVFSEYAQRNDIDNEPKDPEILRNLQILCSRMEAVRFLLGKPIRISSGYRCYDLNKAIGGSKSSAHLRGLACDFTVFGMSNYEAAVIIAESKIPFDQLILEFSWLHFGLSLMPLRNELLTKKSKLAPYVPGLIA